MPPRKRADKNKRTADSSGPSSEEAAIEAAVHDEESKSESDRALPGRNVPVHDPEPDLRQSDQAERLPVICVGASAGGLEALERMFVGLDSEAGAAYVIIMHLSPEHKSQLAMLIQRFTEKVATEITEDMPLERDHVYVIPPNRTLGILNNRFQLLERPQAAPHDPINFFMRALARDKKDCAIGVILSGSGNDGAHGVRAIKSELGMVMAQEPETARFPSMPKAAINTGLVDYVVPPEQMGDRLRNYLARVQTCVKPADVQNLDLSTQESLSKVFFLLRNKSGHDFSQYKKSTILRRIQRRMRVHQLDDMASYVRLLQESGNEVSTLFRELLIGVTAFFRDPDGFEVLRREVLPAIIQSKRDSGDIRIWLPGVATGEEAYTMAICVQEALLEAQRNCRVQIFATDINEEAIDIARTGLYPPTIEEDLSAERLEKFFTHVNDHYKVRRELREMVVFALQDLIRDPPFTKLDLICCRNLLIYLDGGLQKKLLPLFHYSLSPHGFLFLGSSETIGEFGDLFETFNSKWKVYQRKQVGNVPHAAYEFPIRQTEGKSKAAASIRDHPPLPQLVERQLLEEFAPACVIVNRNGNIFYIHGRTGKFLEPAPGEAALNVFDMAREGLNVRLPGLVRKAASQQKQVTYDGLRVKTNGGMESVNVSVKPLDAARDGESLLMVYFEIAQPPPEARRRQGEGRESESYVQDLEQELHRTKENLQTTIEELQTSNEELKSMNEEYQSTNEELQSANEELETSREEMQSLNEELATVNEELQEKIAGLTRNHEDMRLFLNSLNLPTIFLDNDLRIQRFTSQATRLLNILEHDTGRPLSHISDNLRDVSLTEEARKVQENMQQVEREVQDAQGRWHLMRILPYRSTEQQMAGVVVTFVDIDELKKVRDILLATQSQHQFISTVLDTIRNPVVVLDDEFRILTISDTFCRALHWSRREVIGRNLFELLKPMTDDAAFRTALEGAIEGDNTFTDLVLNLHVQNKQKRMTFYGRNADGINQHPTAVILVAQQVEDVDS